MGLQFSVQRIASGMLPPTPSLSVMMQSPPGAVQSLSSSQNSMQVATVGVVWMHWSPTEQSLTPQSCPCPTLPAGTHCRLTPTSEHCSPAAHPHCGRVSLHGFSVQELPV